MSITPHILLESKRITPFVKQIGNEFNKVVSKIRAKMPISHVDVVIYDNLEESIPEIGIGGYTPNAHLVFIFLDPQFPDFKKTIDKQLKKVLAHELHHAIRWKNPGYGKTLVANLVSEGLADHFDLEINGGNPEPWCTALRKDEIDILFLKAQKEFNSKNYDRNAWLFGSEEKGIPKWSGYSLGFKIVGDFLKKNPDKFPSTLYNTKTNVFL